MRRRARPQCHPIRSPGQGDAPYAGAGWGLVRRNISIADLNSRPGTGVAAQAATSGAMLTARIRPFALVQPIGRRARTSAHWRRFPSAASTPKALTPTIGTATTATRGRSPGPGRDGEPQRTQQLCDLALGSFPVDGAAVAVRSGPSSCQLIHATDAIVAQLTEMECTLGEGPALDSMLSREPVLIDDVQAENTFERWPGFAYEASETGARAISAFPLGVAEVPFGVVEFYSRRSGVMTTRAVIDACSWADDLSRAVLADLMPGQGGGTSMASFRSTAVAQATGMVSVQLKSSIPHALALLRARAFAQGRPLADLADDVLARRCGFG